MKTRLWLLIPMLLLIAGLALAGCQPESPPTPAVDPSRFRVTLSSITPVVPAAQPNYAAKASRNEGSTEPEPEPDPYPNVLWKFQTRGSIWGTPSVNDGVVFAGSDDFSLYAVDILSGELKWKFTTQGYVRSRPAVEGGMVYIASDDGYLYAVDEQSGKQVWRTDIGSVTSQDQRANLGSSTSPFGYDTMQSSPVPAGAMVYVGSADGNLYALDASTGAVLWRYFTGSKIRATPLYENGVVYIGSWSKSFYALDASTGRELWQTPLGGQVQTSALASAGLVYSASRKASVVAMDAGTGEIRWEYDYGENMWVESSPHLANGILYIGSSGNRQVVGLDPRSGTLATIFFSNMFNWSTPLVVGETLYFGGANYDNPGFSGLMAVSLPGGRFAKPNEYLWLLEGSETLAAGGSWSGVVSSPVEVYGILFFGGLDGILYALGL